MQKIFIDPGHGGADPGASGHGIQEKDVNLAVALLTRDMLHAHGVNALMIRTNDSYMSLRDRTTLANNKQADAFVSIHHNAATNTAARGLEIYHSIVGGEGQRLANLIHDQYRALIPELPSRGVKTKKGNDGRDYYHVIRETRMPAVIVEGAFLTNPQDADLLKTRDFQEREARAISQAVLLWYGKEIDNGEGTPILGPPRATVAQAQEWARSRRAHQRFIDIAPVYWQIGQQIGIRPEVLYCQSAKETAFGKYGGAVRPEQNNWCGVKTKNATGDKPEDHESFPTPEDGVRAHFNHICAYVGLNPIGEPHGRYHLVKGLEWAGTVRTVEELGGKWAPNSDYGKSIVRDYLAGLLSTETPEKNGTELLRKEVKELRRELAKTIREMEGLRDKLNQIRSIIFE